MPSHLVSVAAPRHFLISHYPTPHHFHISPRPTPRTSVPHPTRVPPLPYLFPPTLRTSTPHLIPCPTASVSHLAPHLALQHLIPSVPHHSHISPFQRFTLPRPTPSCISLSHTLRSHAPRRAASFRSPQYVPTPSPPRWLAASLLNPSQARLRP